MMEIPITVFYEYHSQEKVKNKKAHVISSLDFLKSLFKNVLQLLYFILFEIKKCNFNKHFYEFKNFTIKIT